MTENIVQLPDKIKQELHIDEQGKVTASVRGVARLANVDKESIAKSLRTGGDLEPSKMAVFIITNGFESGDLNNWILDGIPDLAIALILEYYGYECQQRYRKEQAKKLCRAFRAIGFRVWAQQQLNWQNQSSLSISDAIALANVASETAQKAGVSLAIAESMKLDSLMAAIPESKPLLQPQKNAIASVNHMEEDAVNPTVTGQRLALKLNLEKVSARAVNKKLLQLGYQQSVTRINSKGKEVHDYYKPTEKTILGKFGHLEMSSYISRGGGNTKYQLRWFSSIVEILANNWEAK